MKALTLLLSVVTLSLLVLPHYVDAAYWDDVVDQDTAQGGTDTHKKARMILAHVVSGGETVQQRARLTQLNPASPPSLDPDASRLDAIDAPCYSGSSNEQLYFNTIRL